MDESLNLLEYSHKKLDEIPQEILDHGEMLQELYLDCNNIEILPKEFFNLRNIKILSLTDNNLCELSEFLGNLKCLEFLYFSKNCVSVIPENIQYCQELVEVDASVNPIDKLPDGLFHLPNLTHLILNETYLDSLPEDIGRLSQLKVLELRQNQLSFLPTSVENFHNLEHLDIGNNHFMELPISIGHMTKLEELLADGNAIEELPRVIGLLENLILLDISMNKLETLPPEIGSLNCLTDLYMSGNELLEVHENIGSLCCLETLKLSENDVLTLPSSIGRLKNLEELDVSMNNLEILPCSIGQLQRLKVLNLENNCIQYLPDEIGNCLSLSLLSLHNNNLVNVPESLGKLRNLQMINLSSNRLNFLPVTFLDLKNLKALWLEENQAKPLIHLERIFEPKANKEVLVCSLLSRWNSWDGEEKADENGSESEKNSDESFSNDNKEIVTQEEFDERTSGSISECLLHKVRNIEEISCENVDDRGMSWFVVSQEEQSLKEQEIYAGKNLEESEDFGKSLREEKNISWDEVIDLSSSGEITTDNVVITGNIDYTEKTRHACIKGTNKISLWNPSEVASHADAGGAVENDRNKELSLVERRYSTGNTSYNDLISVEYRDDETQHSLVLKENDEKMRLLFSNKRRRNGNQVGTYEAFKPTRFNLYARSDEPLWSTIKKDDSLESSSPTLKKKSVTVKLNPLIGARLARDASPAREISYTVTQKYEDKIRTLQQQRQKERIRRRNYSTRPVDNTLRSGENFDLTFTGDVVFPSSYNEYHKYRLRQTASLSSPTYYIISDDDDSVAIKLRDFRSPQNVDEKKGMKSPPVDSSFENYTNDYEQRGRRQNGMLQKLQSHKRILQSFSNEYDNDCPSRLKETYPDGCEKFNEKHYRRQQGTEVAHESTTLGRDDLETFANYDQDTASNNEQRFHSNHSVVYTGGKHNGLLRNSKKQFELKENIQHVTIKCREIMRPVSIVTTEKCNIKTPSVSKENTNISSLKRDVTIKKETNDDIISVSARKSTLNESQKDEMVKMLVTDLDAIYAASPLSRNAQKGEKTVDRNYQVVKIPSGPTRQIQVSVYRNPSLGFSIAGGKNTGSPDDAIYVFSVRPDGPSSHFLRYGDHILEVNEINLRSVCHEHAVLFLTHNQQLDLLIERVITHDEPIH